jgi:hypothetical protein
MGRSLGSGVMSVAYSRFQVDLLSILLWGNLLCPGSVVVNGVTAVSHHSVGCEFDSR